MLQPFFSLQKLKQLTRLVLLGLLCWITQPLYAQIQSVTTLQHLSFGAFSPGASGGTLTISNSGVRSATGTIVPLNLGAIPTEAIFEIEAPQGTVISLLSGPDISLVGSTGGTMSLRIGTSDHGSSFISTVAPPGKTTVHVGGTLSVGNGSASPQGTYSGTFSIIFNNE